MLRDELVILASYCNVYCDVNDISVCNKCHRIDATLLDMQKLLPEDKHTIYNPVSPEYTTLMRIQDTRNKILSEVRKIFGDAK